MWLIYTKRGKVVLSPGYCQYWASRQDALAWAVENGYDEEEIEICPTLHA